MAKMSIVELVIFNDEVMKHPQEYRDFKRCRKCKKFITKEGYCNSCGIIWTLQISESGKTISWTESENFEVG